MNVLATLQRLVRREPAPQDAGDSLHGGPNGDGGDGAGDAGGPPMHHPSEGGDGIDGGGSGGDGGALNPRAARWMATCRVAHTLAGHFGVPDADGSVVEREHDPGYESETVDTDSDWGEEEGSWSSGSSSSGGDSGGGQEEGAADERSLDKGDSSREGGSDADLEAALSAGGDQPRASQTGVPPAGAAKSSTLRPRPPLATASSGHTALSPTTHPGDSGSPDGVGSSGGARRRRRPRRDWRPHRPRWGGRDNSPSGRAARGDLDVRYGDEAMPRTKLEVFSARALIHIERGALVTHLAAVAYAVALGVLASGRYAARLSFFPDVGAAGAFVPVEGASAADPVVVSVGVFPAGLLVCHIAAAAVMTAAAAVAAAWFTVRVAGLPCSARTDEQLWAAALLWAATLFLAPTHEVDAYLVLGALRRVLDGSPGGFAAADAAAATSAVHRLGAWSASMTSNGWAAFMFWYVGTSTASFRVLPGQGRRLRFYGPRLAVLTAHTALRVGLSTARPRPRLALSVFPVAPVAYLYREARAASPPAPSLTKLPINLAGACVVITVEVALFAWILFEAYCTTGALAGVPYALMRTKHVGWRSFRHHVNLVVLSVTAATAAAAALAPDGLPTLAARTGAALWLAEPLGMVIPAKVLVLVYAIVEGVVNLPPDVVGWRGLIHRMPVEAHTCATMMRTRLRERHARLPAGEGFPIRGGSGDGSSGGSGMARQVSRSGRGRRFLLSQPRTFVLETQARMLNLAWMAYMVPPPPAICPCPTVTWGAHDRIDATHRIYDAATDTHAVIAALDDRFVIAFRGTSSRQNLRTDAAVRVLPVGEALGEEVAAMAVRLRAGKGGADASGEASGRDPRVHTAADTSPVPTGVREGGGGGAYRVDDADVDGASAEGVEEGALWRQARIHAGFARAYAAVRGDVESQFRAFRAADPLRPWFIVGHSLGGALAVLCALHLQVVYGERTAVAGEAGVEKARDASAAEAEAAAEAARARPRPGSNSNDASEGGGGGDGGAGDGSNAPSRPPTSFRLSVTTFGSPKGGNAAYAALATRWLPEHWRIFAANDVITKSPPMRWYTHTGTPVLVDRSGNLFIEPLRTIKRFFHRDASSLGMHHKGAYLLCLAAAARATFAHTWRSRVHATPAEALSARVLWDWPLPPATTRRFVPARRRLNLALVTVDLPVGDLGAGLGDAGSGVAAAVGGVIRSVRDLPGVSAVADHLPSPPWRAAALPTRSYCPTQRGRWARLVVLLLRRAAYEEAAAAAAARGSGRAGRRAARLAARLHRSGSKRPAAAGEAAGAASPDGGEADASPVDVPVSAFERALTARGGVGPCPAVAAAMAGKHGEQG